MELWPALGALAAVPHRPVLRAWVSVLVIADYLAAPGHRVGSDLRAGFQYVDHFAAADVHADVVGVAGGGAEEHQITGHRRADATPFGDLVVGVVRAEDVPAIGERVDPAGEPRAVQPDSARVLGMRCRIARPRLRIAGAGAGRGAGGCG